MIGLNYRYKIEYLNTAGQAGEVCLVAFSDSSLAGAILHARVNAAEARIHNRAVSFRVRDDLRRGIVVAAEPLRGF